MNLGKLAAFAVAGLVMQQVAAQSIDARDLPTPEGVRQYMVMQPRDLGGDLHPLLILLHGHGSTAAFMLGQNAFLGFKSDGWQRLAARENLLVIAPQGVKGADGKFAWNDCRGDATTNAPTDDVAFIAALIDRAIKVYRADPRRVYVYGSSNGGGMAYRLGIELAPRLAGIAAQSALMPAHSACKAPAQALPVFITHGTEDSIAPYGGGAVGNWGLRGRGTGLSAEASVAVWRKLAGLPETPIYHRFPKSGKTSALSTVWGSDPRGVQVEFLRIDGGGHTWSSRTEELPWLLGKVLGEMNHDVDTTEEVWNFFREKRAVAN
ncbi:alpha/beta hydrolase family esterase [Pseudoduganella violaceinigra]|uniref:alpha/beta hydrolase family esterase n=1 Tax=Pseudoduganella violaceinigra TaxID=246602 RepID=UPI0003F8A14B|nr:PHB depolymerase family esterase [Pseudoduganella violaceinigra]